MQEDPSMMQSFFANPHAVGFAAGVALTTALGLAGLWSVFRRNWTLNRDNRRLRESLDTKFMVEADSMQRMRQDLEGLREENNRLRLQVEMWMVKPKKQDLRLLYIYNRAIDLMKERAPGFVGAWALCLKEAEEQLDQAAKGKIPFVSRLFRVPSSGLLTSAPAEEKTNNGGA